MQELKNVEAQRKSEGKVCFQIDLETQNELSNDCENGLPILNPLQNYIFGLAGEAPLESTPRRPFQHVWICKRPLDSIAQLHHLKLSASQRRVRSAFIPFGLAPSGSPSLHTDSFWNIFLNVCCWCSHFGGHVG